MVTDPLPLCPGRFPGIVGFRKRCCARRPGPGPPGPLPCLAEAAYTLLLYDELLEWSDRPLREFLSYPTQTEWQRKELLHLAVIQNFDRGKVRARGRPLTDAPSSGRGLPALMCAENTQECVKMRSPPPGFLAGKAWHRRGFCGLKEDPGPRYFIL